MDSPEKLAIYGPQDEDKQKQNTKKASNMDSTKIYIYVSSFDYGTVFMIC